MKSYTDYAGATKFDLVMWLFKQFQDYTLSCVNDELKILAKSFTSIEDSILLHAHEKN